MGIHFLWLVAPKKISTRCYCFIVIAVSGLQMILGSEKPFGKTRSSSMLFTFFPTIKLICSQPSRGVTVQSFIRNSIGSSSGQSSRIGKHTPWKMQFSKVISAKERLQHHLCPNGRRMTASGLLNSQFRITILPGVCLIAARLSQ